MKNNNLFSLLTVSLVLVLMVSCKTKFEKIRTSQDPDLILKEAHSFYEAEEYYKAITLYEIIIPLFRGKGEAEKIFYNFAYSHYHTNQSLLASHYFNTFAKTYTNSEQREEAAYMAAYSNYGLSPSHKLDQSYSQKAIEGLQEFVNKYPLSDRVETCNNLIDEIRGKMELKAYDQGMLYYKMGHYNSSMQSFENMLKDFPETGKAEEIRYLIGKSAYILAKNSIYEKKEERYLQAIDKCQSFLKKYISSSYKKDIDSYIEDSNNEINKLKNG